MPDPDKIECPTCKTIWIAVGEVRKPGYVPIDEIQCVNGHRFARLAMTARQLRGMTDA